MSRRDFSMNHFSCRLCHMFGRNVFEIIEGQSNSQTLVIRLPADGLVILMKTELCPSLGPAYIYIYIYIYICIYDRTFKCWIPMLPSQWRHNGHDSVSNHQPHDCLLKRFFRRRSKITSKLRVTGLCEGNSPGTGEFPAQRASNAENASIRRCHHVERIIPEK